MSAGRWPNLFLVGVSKAGTTSLAGWLGRHPDVFMSPLKEPYFFTRATPPLVRTVKDEREYLALFGGARGERYRAEASPSYFWDETSPPAIRKASPEASIVIALRDPVERAYSHYWTAVRYGLEQRTFLDAVRSELELSLPLGHGAPAYVDRGFYAERVERYRGLFDGRVHVVLFEEMSAAPEDALGALLLELGLEPEPIELRRENAFALPRNAAAGAILRSPRMRRAVRALLPQAVNARAESLLLQTGEKPPMEPEARELLTAAYAEDRLRLPKVLGRDPTW